MEILAFDNDCGHTKIRAEVKVILVLFIDILTTFHSFCGGFLTFC